MNFLDAAERLSALDRSQVRLDPARCLHELDRFSDCQACFGVCPVAAIQAGKPPTLGSSACAGCLACLPACPAGAFSAGDAVASLLSCAARVETRSVELRCARHPAGEGALLEGATAIRLRGCLAGLGLGAYLGLAALGLEAVVARLDACAACPWGALRGRVETQARQAAELLAALGVPSEVRLAAPQPGEAAHACPVWDADNPPLSRRDLFRLASRQGQVAAARMMAKEDGHSGPRLPLHRQRTLNALAHLPHPEAAEASLAGFGFALVSVGAECTACGVCARVCPTGALHFEQSEGKTSFRLDFTPSHCTACGACTHVCASGVVALRDDPAYAEVFPAASPGAPLTLIAGELIRCTVCNIPFAAHAGQKLCPVCAFRRANPFGSRLPPGFRPGGPLQKEDGNR